MIHIQSMNMILINQILLMKEKLNCKTCTQLSVENKPTYHTPGTRGAPGGRDKTKSYCEKRISRPLLYQTKHLKYILFHLSSICICLCRFALNLLWLEIKVENTADNSRNTYYTKGRLHLRKKLKYSRDCGWHRRPWPNAGLKKSKNLRQSAFFRKKIKIT